MKPKDQVLEVWGELACFTRPEMKVERFSYPVITPSAARGIYDAIYCKPKEFRWQITRVEILKPPSYIALRRNEVGQKISTNNALSAMSGEKSIKPIIADDEKHRQQRQTMALKDVTYRLHAEIIPREGFDSRLQGFEEQFRRRARYGKCVYQPYLGCREFPAYFNLLEPNTPLSETVDLTWKDLGWMLYDVFDLSKVGSNTDSARISLFQPVVNGGIMEIPPFESPEVYKLEAGD